MKSLKKMVIYWSKRASILCAILISVVVYMSLSNIKTRWKTQDTQKTNLIENMDLVRKCQPKKNVMFLKTHKTGSSTVTNILNRFCDNNNLKMALPNPTMMNFFWPIPFEPSFAEESSVNMLSNHARFSDVMTRFMPLNTMYFTILRKPASQFESLFSYMSFASLFGLQHHSNSMNTFLENPWGFLMNLLRTEPNIAMQQPYINLLKSGQFFDLGLDSNDFNISDVHTAIRKLEKIFQLVLITEYFDESMVLLARNLCWSINDVLYFKQNQRHFDEKVPYSLSIKAVNNFRQWNKADILLYEHFNATFWFRLRQQDASFWKEVEILKGMNKKMSDICLIPGEHQGRIYENQSKRIIGFKVKKKGLNDKLRAQCNQMVNTEIDYIKYFRKKYHNSDPK